MSKRYELKGKSITKVYPAIWRAENARRTSWWYEESQEPTEFCGFVTDEGKLVYLDAAWNKDDIVFKVSDPYLLDWIEGLMQFLFDELEKAWKERDKQEVLFRSLMQMETGEEIDE